MDIKTALGAVDRDYYDKSSIRPYPFLRNYYTYGS